MSCIGGLMVRALTWNVEGVWFDSHPKLNFSVIIRCSRNVIPLFIITFIYIVALDHLFNEF